MKQIKTQRFGDLEIDEQKIVTFDDGISPFVDEHEFVLLPYDIENNSPYVFMQSVDTPELAFLMTNPFVFFSDYAFELDDTNQQELGITSQDQMDLFVLLTIPSGSIPNMTANLMAPIVINTNTMKGKQIVLDKGGYTTKHRLFKKKPQDSTSESKTENSEKDTAMKGAE